ncbi:MAG: hypothetical protein FWE82_10410 [Defluviitaleaceae bacterium]|nr:hypothetical protein [Defluviitaleaceae bacterium]
MNPYVMFDLSEDWYNARFGADFSESFWSDPVKRTESYRELHFQTAKKYPSLGLGSLEPEPSPRASDQYGHRFIPKMFGCEIKYTANQAPSCIALDYDFDMLASLDMPDLQRNDVYKKGLDDAAVLKEKYGFVHSWINTGSPLNAAVSTFGESFIAACAIEPEIAQHVLMVFAKTFIRMQHEFEDLINPPKRVYRDGYGIGNCPAIMFSPQLYRETILPVDLWLRQQFKGFGIHHCGKIDNYAKLYTALSPTGLDIGGGSDYTVLRKYFPEVHCTYIVNPEHYEGKTTEEIDALVRGIVSDGGPVERIVCLHTYGTGRDATDQNIIDLRTSLIRQGFAKDEK